MNFSMLHALMMYIDPSSPSIFATSLLSVLMGIVGGIVLVAGIIVAVVLATKHSAPKNNNNNNQNNQNNQNNSF